MREDNILPYEVAMILDTIIKNGGSKHIPTRLNFNLGYKAPPKQTAMFVKEENLRRRSRNPQTLNKTAKCVEIICAAKTRLSLRLWKENLRKNQHQA